MRVFPLKKRFPEVRRRAAGIWRSPGRQSDPGWGALKEMVRGGEGPSLPAAAHPQHSAEQVFGLNGDLVGRGTDGG